MYLLGMDVVMFGARHDACEHLDVGPFHDLPISTRRHSTAVEMLATALLTAGALLHGGSRAHSGLTRSSRAAMSGAYDFSARDLKTNDVVQLDQYEGQVALIVNLASA